jgi:hypothetical protein
MPLQINITDTAAIAVTLSATTNATYDDLYDVNLTDVKVDNFLTSGTFLRLAITYPTVGGAVGQTTYALQNTIAVADAVSSIAGGSTGTNAGGQASYTFPPTGGSVRIATVATNKTTTQNPVFGFTLQSSATGVDGTWTSVAQTASGVQYIIAVSAVNYVFEIMFSNAISVPTITPQSVAANSSTGSAVPTPASITIDGIVISLIAPAPITTGVDYRLTLPEDTTNNIDVNSIRSVVVVSTPPVDVAAAAGTLDHTYTELRGTTLILKTNLKWSRAVAVSFDAGLGVITAGLPSTTFIPAGHGITFNVGINGTNPLVPGSIVTLSSVAGVAASNIIFSALTLAVV